MDGEVGRYIAGGENVGHTDTQLLIRIPCNQRYKFVYQAGFMAVVARHVCQQKIIVLGSCCKLTSYGRKVMDLHCV